MRSDALRTCKAVCFNEKKIEALRRKVSAMVEIEATARRYKALGHPARLAIIRTLEIEECCVCDLANILDKPVSTVSQHLRMLSSTGLIKSRQEGKLVFYTLAFEGSTSRLIDVVSASDRK